MLSPRDKQLIIDVVSQLVADFLIQRLGRRLLHAEIEVGFTGSAIDVEVHVETDLRVPDAELRAIVEGASAYGVEVADTLVELIKAGRNIGDVEEAKRIVVSVRGGERGGPQVR